MFFNDRRLLAMAGQMRIFSAKGPPNGSQKALPANANVPNQVRYA
jgi:hypothetical protein